MHQLEPQPPTTLELVILAVLTIHLSLALPIMIIVQLIRAFS